MHRTFGLLAVLSIFACTTISKPPAAPASTERTIPGRAATFEGAEEFRLLRMRDENGRIAPDAYIKALQQREAMLPARATGGGISRNSWTWLGPGNVGGRVTAVVSEPGLLLINNPGGGIWKSTNGGASWAPVNDFLSNLAVSTIAASPTDPKTLYAGTGGGPNQSDDSFGTQLRGAGIFKSTDGGDSWTQLPSTAAPDWSRGIEKIAVSPDGQTILAAVKFYYSDSPAAIMRSTDGGSTWTDTLKVAGASGNAVAFNPKDSTQAIAASLDKAWYSIDGGASWTQATGLPTIGATGLVTVAYAKSDPTIVYAGVNNNGGEVYKSTDGGKSYALVNTGTNYTGTQGWYCNVLWVDPTNANTVLVAGLDVFRSTDGGQNFTKISKWEKAATKSAHADHGVLAAAFDYDGQASKDVYFGNDGGIYRVRDIYSVTEETGWELLNNNLGITQLYGAAVNAQSGVIMAGAQDNGTQRYSGDLNKWSEWQGGDGGYCAADPTNPNIFYGEYTNMTIYRSDDGGIAKPDDIYGLYDSFDGTQWTKQARPGAITEAKSPTANFIAPFILDPNKPNRMLAGARSLWASDNVNVPKSDGWPSWTAIKQPTGNDSSNNISAIAVAPGNSDIIWVGHNNGDVFTTSNGTSPAPAWTQINTGNSPLPKRFVTRLAVDPSDSKTVYATFGGYSDGNVWKTTDGGATWNNATGSGAGQLPQAPVYTIAIHPKRSASIYVGTEVGIFASEDGGTTWTVPHDGPANVSVNELFFSGTTLYAATFGRGLYKVDVPTATSASLRCYSLSIESTSRGAVVPATAPNCNGSQYTEGSVVRLRARPAHPFHFAKWNGDATGDRRETTVTMDRDRSVSAEFTTATATCYAFVMNVTPAGGGDVAVSPAPDCGSNGYTADTEVTFQAKPKNGYAFGGWYGDYWDVDPEGSITMDGDATVSAVFALPATNDEIANAIDLAASNTISEDTTTASGNPGDPDLCEAGKSGKTVWFTYTAPASGTLTLDTAGSDYHTILAVFTGTKTSLKRIACTANALPGQPIADYGDSELASDELASVRIPVSAGTTYIVEVGDATQPVRKENEYDSGDDASDTPDGGLLQLKATFSGTAGRHRATKH